jgi:hypothetical protein
VQRVELPELVGPRPLEADGQGAGGFGSTGDGIPGGERPGAPAA